MTTANNLQNIIDSSAKKGKGYMLDRSRRVLGPAPLRSTKGGNASNAYESATPPQEDQGIATPLEEQSRSYYLPKQFVSPDGWLVFNSSAMQSIMFKDANDKEVELRFTNQ
jgi:hypothetical protein